MSELDLRPRIGGRCGIGKGGMGTVYEIGE
jgi:hypothetical protein